MDLMAELEQMPQPQFLAFKLFCSKQMSMPRVVEHCVANDLGMKAMEAGRGDSPPVGRTPIFPTLVSGADCPDTPANDLQAPFVCK